MNSMFSWLYFGISILVFHYILMYFIVYFKCINNMYFIILFFYLVCVYKGLQLVGLRACSGLPFCTTHSILIFLCAIKVIN